MNRVSPDLLRSAGAASQSDKLDPLRAALLKREHSRVDLVISGHTHGGQAYLPTVGTVWMPSQYGDKYRGELVQGPASQVFVSRGLGEAGVPLRLNCPPEINVLTLIPT